MAKRPNFQKFLKRLQAVAPTVVAVYDHPAAFTTPRKRWSFVALMERMPQVQVVMKQGTFDR